MRPEADNKDPAPCVIGSEGRSNRLLAKNNNVMAQSRPTKKYPCSQAELYAICSIGWQSYDENLPDFSDFSSKYDAQFSINAKAAIESAKQLPDFQARNEPSETSYTEMVKTVNTCNRNFRKLRRHITNAFNKDVVKGKIEAAGEEHYKKSMNRNWAETELMLTSATTFITDNNAALTAGGMPAQFVTDFATARTAFFGYYGTFTDSEQDEVEGTDEKVIANNGIYDTLMGMFEDGQVIYEEDAAKRARFTFSRVWALISSTGGGGSSSVPADTIELGVYAYDSVTELPLVGAIVRVLNGPLGVVEAVTGDDGIAVLTVSGYAPNATVMVDSEVEAEGYELISASVEMTAGNAYSFDAPYGSAPRTTSRTIASPHGQKTHSRHPPLFQKRGGQVRLRTWG